MASVIKIEREFRSKIKSWDKEAQETGKFFCHTCARNDFDKGILGDSWTNYANDLTFISSSFIRNVKDQSKILGKMEDWKCPKGHGISVEKLKESEKEKA